MKNSFLIAGIVLVIVLIGGVLWYQQLVNTTQPLHVMFSPMTASSPLPSDLVSASPSVSPTPSPSTVLTDLVPAKAVSSGNPSGQATCNYVTPATPGQYGTGDIAVNWNNLHVGSNGSVKADVCVSTNSGSYTLVSSSSQVSGNTTVSAPWLSVGSHYTFSLFDDRGGDVGACGGEILSGCQINVPGVPSAVTTSSRGSGP